jgi:hypothetical protein
MSEPEITTVEDAIPAEKTTSLEEKLSIPTLEAVLRAVREESYEAQKQTKHAVYTGGNSSIIFYSGAVQFASGIERLILNTIADNK